MSRQVAKVGDRIRFLSAVGGGKVVRIERDTAWVEGEDGFEIPTLLKDCVVVEERDTFVPSYKPPMRHQGGRQETETISTSYGLKEEKEAEVPFTPLKPHTYLPASGELNAYLAILPLEENALGKTDYELFLINDSRYSLYYVLSLQLSEGAKYQLKAHGLLDPDKQHFLLEIAHSELPQWERINVQLLAIAENPGLFQGSYAIELRLVSKKLFNRGSFTPNDFFEDDAYIIELVRESKIAGKSSKLALENLPENFRNRSLSSSAENKSQAQHKPKQDLTDSLVFDLHIDQLLDSTSGMSSADILQYQLGHFNKVMQEHVAHTGRKLIFIHGKGDGVLRNKLLSELRYRYKHCHYQDASFQEYGFGATLITIGNKARS